MHQLGILGSHQHRCGDRSKLFGADGVAIEPYEPAARCESDLHDAAAVGVAEAAGDERLVFTEPDGISDASERKVGRQAQVTGRQQVRLPAAVVAGDEVEARQETQAGRDEVTEVELVQQLELHRRGSVSFGRPVHGSSRCTAAGLTRTVAPAARQRRSLQVAGERLQQGTELFAEQPLFPLQPEQFIAGLTDAGLGVADDLGPLLFSLVHQPFTPGIGITQYLTALLLGFGDDEFRLPFGVLTDLVGDAFRRDHHAFQLRFGSLQLADAGIALLLGIPQLLVLAQGVLELSGHPLQELTNLLPGVAVEPGREVHMLDIERAQFHLLDSTTCAASYRLGRQAVTSSRKIRPERSATSTTSSPVAW